VLKWLVHAPHEELGVPALAEGVCTHELKAASTWKISKDRGFWNFGSCRLQLGEIILLYTHVASELQG